MKVRHAMGDVRRERGEDRPKGIEKGSGGDRRGSSSFGPEDHDADWLTVFMQ